jgi:hypothetical protein
MKSACITLIVIVALATVALAGQAISKEVAAKLEGITIELNLKEASLTSAVEKLSDVTGLNFVIDPVVFEGRADADFNINLRLKSIKAQSALNLLCNLYSLACASSDEAVIITLPERLVEEPILTVYDVFDLTELTQFSPQARDFYRGSPNRFDPSYTYVSPSWYLYDPYAFGKLLDRYEARPVIGPEALIKLVMDTVPADWSEEAGTGIGYGNGELIVCQTPEVQLKIAQMLYRMRMRQ